MKRSLNFRLLFVSIYIIQLNCKVNTVEFFILICYNYIRI